MKSPSNMSLPYASVLAPFSALRRPLIALSVVSAAVFALKTSSVVTSLSTSMVSPALAADEDGEPDKASKVPEGESEPNGDSILIEAPAEDFGDDPAMMSQSELALLRDLGKRRTALDARERDLEMRTRLLEAAEKRVEGKITELKALEGKVQSLLVKYESQENEKITSVVKVYEKMKPADAARILEGLSMSIQLDVATRMSELRMAPILAKMSAKGAQRLTTQLATKQALDLGTNVN